ncbi:MAG: TonB-dependent receptor, partial [Rikenellaceae bacterium]|nr:TonB-dependent receptor [Rikenellaceae bacterium]
SGYDRRWLLGSAHLRYQTSEISVASTTSFQHFDDKMTLDQDFTTADLFTMRQKQNQNAATQEVIVKSERRSAYKWLFGAFGFYKGLTTQAPVELKKDFFASLFPTLAPPMHVGPSGDCNSGGVYDTPSWGAAAFHQSDFSTGDVTFSVGLRLDYERISIDHNTSGSLPFEIRMPPTFQPQYYSVSAKIAGDDSQEFLQFSPKLSVNWTPFELDGDRIYASVSRGYRAGGYNIQLFSDLISGEIEAGGKQAMTARGNVDRQTELEPDVISYKPEYSWNYEIGGRKSFFRNKVSADFALFYIDTRNQQVTQFVPSGLGRVMRNAARSASYGAEIWAHGTFGNTGVDVAWGYTHATFRDYSDSVRVLNPATQKYETQHVDYSGNYVPFSPRQTLTAGVQQTFPMRSGAWIESITAGVRYTGAGKIFFTESNGAEQDFYGLLSADITFDKGPVSLCIWGKNLTDTTYKTFFFHGIMNNDFAQLGNPLQIGVTLKFKL